MCLYGLNSYKQINPVQQSMFTNVGVPLNPALSLETVKSWVGAYDDDSDDVELTGLIFAAEKKIRELSNIIVSRTQVIDHFKAQGRFLQLKHDCTNIDSVDSVTYINNDDMESVISQNNYILDTSIAVSRIAIKNNISLQNLSISKYVENPIMVSYFSGDTIIQSGLPVETEGAHLLITCMNMLISAYYDSKGADLKLVANAEKAVAMMLRNYRLGIG